MDIASIGQRHLSDALAGKLSHCVVSEWKDEAGEPIKIYWKPLTGKAQKKIDEFSTIVERTCATVKFRALDEAGNLVFSKTPMASLTHDYDYNVLRAIAYLMATEVPDDIDERSEDLEKE